MNDELHPYDGRERRFRDDDADPERRARGLALVARLLRLPAPPPARGLRYDLSYYSGGIGVIDCLYVAMPCAPADAEAIAARAGLLSPEAMGDDAERREAFEWLVRGEARPEATTAEAVAAFIDERRVEFQPPPGARARAWFWPDSDVNAWSLIYAAEGQLGFIAYDQG
ncbi:MAG TPA: hypothetical protein VFS43_42400 [Polyangiaceae bacterium]|nr:hypothetical protein [Polyangiaceae bacterium]